MRSLLLRGFNLLQFRARGDSVLAQGPNLLTHASGRPDVLGLVGGKFLANVCVGDGLVGIELAHLLQHPCTFSNLVGAAGTIVVDNTHHRNRR